MRRLGRRPITRQPDGEITSFTPCSLWSGRRGSNPRPTAWKAVTLPLSYSRLCAARPHRAAFTLIVGLPSVALLRALSSRALRRAKDGGEGRTRTFEAARATDLQSAAFDRFATSPTVCVCWKRAVFLKSDQFSGAGEGIRTPDLLITNQLLYRPELRQHKRRTLARPVPPVQVIAGSGHGRATAALLRTGARPATFYSIRLARRWRTASKSATAAAVETFRL